jgi:replicative DNA helicase
VNAGRTPPHDPAAEQAILGITLSLGRIPDQVTLAPADFYQPRHEMIWAAILHLASHGQPTDVHAVRARLIETGDLKRNGGELYLLECLQAPPGDPLYLQGIIVDRAGLRRIIIASEQAAMAAYAMEASYVEILRRTELAHAHLDNSVTDELDTLQPLDDFLGNELPEPEWVIPGLLASRERLIITGGEGLGKALALDTPVPTPKGWSTMGDLTIGAQVFAPDGRPAGVVAATDVLLDRPCYRVRFSDGSEIIADAEHLWLTETLKAREAAADAARRGPLRPRGTDQSWKRTAFPAVINTRAMAETVLARDGHAVNHSIPVTRPLQYDRQEYPIPPYVLGAWLGDGTSRLAQITCHPDDRAILDRIGEEGWAVRQLSRFTWTLASDVRRTQPSKFLVRLRTLGVLNNKHVPEAYLRGCVEDRLALLQGLMDTDGTVNLTGDTPVCEFSVCSEPLAVGVFDLVLGLGIKATMKSGPAKVAERTVGTRWRISFQTDLPVFHLPRKAARLKPLRTRRAKLRYVVDVEPIESVPVRCIQVDRSDGMFVVGRACIPTHNSVMQRQIGLCAAAGVHPFNWKAIPPATVLVIDVENPPHIVKEVLWGIRSTIRGMGHPIDQNRFWIDQRVGGLDLAHPADRLWLQRRALAVNPALLVIGPAYKLSEARDESRDEALARTVTNVLDEIREDIGCAIVLEHHAGNEQHGSSRPVRPIGSSLWRRWPEFGYGIRKADGLASKERRLVEFVAWRGDRTIRGWPSYMETGLPDGLPWMEAVP